MSIHNIGYHPRRTAGFTLIELLVVIAIIAVLIGLILPTTQHGREVANWDLARKDVSQIVTAEIKAKRLTTDLAALAKLGLIDPTLGTGSKDGYQFTAAILPTGGFQIIGVPAAPGITGALDVMADQTGVVTSKPSRGADEARSAMFAAIDTQAAATLGRVLSQASTDQLPTVQHFFQAGAAQDPAVLKGVFKRLDADGDGKVTLNEALAYDRKGDSGLGGFLATLGRTMQLGLANEEVQSLPGVSLSDLLPAGKDCGGGQFQVKVGRGTVFIGADGAQTSLSLTGLCDGSVRPATHKPVSLDGAEFSALLSGADPNILSGRFVISGQNKATVQGILIGLQKQEGQGARQTLDGFFLVTGGSGATVGAFGSGRASIDWNGLKSDRFDAALEGDLSFALPSVP